MHHSFILVLMSITVVVYLTEHFIYLQISLSGIREKLFKLCFTQTKIIGLIQLTLSMEHVGQ